MALAKNAEDEDKIIVRIALGVGRFRCDLRWWKKWRRTREGINVSFYSA